MCTSFMLNFGTIRARLVMLPSEKTFCVRKVKKTAQLDHARQLLETTACSRRSWRQNCTSDFCSQWSPRSYCCPETSAKQETAKKPCCVRQSPQPGGRLDSRKFDFLDESSVELHPKRRQYCRRPSGARLDPWFTQKTDKFGGGKIKITEVPGRSVRWMDSYDW